MPVFKDPGPLFRPLFVVCWGDVPRLGVIYSLRFHPPGFSVSPLGGNTFSPDDFISSVAVASFFSLSLLSALLFWFYFFKRKGNHTTLKRDLYFSWHLLSCQNAASLAGLVFCFPGVALVFINSRFLGNCVLPLNLVQSDA